MTITSPQPLIVRSRVSASGFLVALVMAIAFLGVGLRTFETSLVPTRLGMFVEPPPWIFAALLIGFAAFMFLIGVAEVARFIRPATEIVIDRDGISTFGLFGERRALWADFIASEFQQGTLSLKLRAKGRMPPPDMRLHFDRLDVDPRTVFATIRERRPDLVPGAEDR